MLFVPLKSKYKKYHKGKRFNKIRIRPNYLKYGNIGLLLLFSARINSKHLTMLYNNIKKRMKKKGRVFVNIFPNLSVTKKPLEVRMGKGKGSLSHWVSKVRGGSVLCEIASSSVIFSAKVLKKVQLKLPVKTKIIRKIY